MDVTLIPEIKAMIQHHLASGAYRSPRSVLSHVLYAWQEVDATREPDKQATGLKRDNPTAATEEMREVLPIVTWLQETAKSRLGLQERRRRLSKKLSGTMAETVRKGRDERI